MITLPAFMGDKSKQKPFLAECEARLADTGAARVSFIQSFGAGHAGLSVLCDKTGAPASFLALCDQLAIRMEPLAARDFILNIFSAMTPGQDLAPIGWSVVEHALVRSIARQGEVFASAARQAPEVFPRLVLPVYTQAMLRKAQRRSFRIARKLGHDEPDSSDPRVQALMRACTMRGDLHAGVVITWTLDQSPDPPLALQSCCRKLLELIKPA
jgi:hypothetical protein